MNTTAWVIVGIVALLIGWDVFAAVRWGYQGTISYDLLSAARARPIVSLAIGVVIGHLFWPQ